MGGLLSDPHFVQSLYDPTTLRCLLIVSTKFSIFFGGGGGGGGGGEACIMLVLILQVGCLSEIHVYSR